MVSILDLQGKVVSTIQSENWKKVAIACDPKALICVLWSDAEEKVTLDRYTMKGEKVDCLLEKASHKCKKLVLAVSSDGTVAIVTATGKEGKVLVIQT